MRRTKVRQGAPLPPPSAPKPPLHLQYIQHDAALAEDEGAVPLRLQLLQQRQHKGALAARVSTAPVGQVCQQLGLNITLRPADPIVCSELQGGRDERGECGAWARARQASKYWKGCPKQGSKEGHPPVNWMDCATARRRAVPPPSSPQPSSSSSSASSAPLPPSSPSCASSSALPEPLPESLRGKRSQESGVVRAIPARELQCHAVSTSVEWQQWGQPAQPAGRWQVPLAGGHRRRQMHASSGPPAACLRGTILFHQEAGVAEHT